MLHCNSNGSHSPLPLPPSPPPPHASSSGSLRRVLFELNGGRVCFHQGCYGDNGVDPPPITAGDSLSAALLPSNGLLLQGIRRMPPAADLLDSCELFTQPFTLPSEYGWCPGPQATPAPLQASMQLGPVPGTMAPPPLAAPAQPSGLEPSIAGPSRVNLSAAARCMGDDLVLPLLTNAYQQVDLRTPGNPRMGSSRGSLRQSDRLPGRAPRPRRRRTLYPCLGAGPQLPYLPPEVWGAVARATLVAEGRGIEARGRLGRVCAAWEAGLAGAAFRRCASRCASS